ncbi:hypothetical protein RFM23_30925, partial [Mesorhizobium abyssinicae]|nr:hypothetical protein [Mesorhizobium abyssinicae]
QPGCTSTILPLIGRHCKTDCGADVPVEIGVTPDCFYGADYPQIYHKDFVALADGADAYLHMRVVEAAGCRSGAHLKVILEERPKGRQVAQR